MQMQHQGVGGDMIQRWLSGADSWLLESSQAILPIQQLELSRQSRAGAERKFGAPSTALHDTTIHNSSEKLDSQ